MRLCPPQALKLADHSVRKEIQKGLGVRCQVLKTYNLKSLYEGLVPTVEDVYPGRSPPSRR
jgi:hypothetical protein